MFPLPPNTNFYTASDRPWREEHESAQNDIVVGLDFAQDDI